MASLAAPRAESWQDKKHEEPKHTHGCARERSIDENGISKARSDLAPRQRPSES